MLLIFPKQLINIVFPLFFHADLILFGKLFRNFALKLLAVAIGSVIYYAVIQAVVSLSGINSNYLKLLSALIVAVFLTVPHWKAKYFTKKRVTGGKSHA